VSDFAPTAYPAVNQLLAVLLAGARQALGEQLVGFYLSGSLATGGFKPGRSDIDFVGVTAAELSPAGLAALRDMHRRIAAGPSSWALKLEGSYFPAAALRRYDRKLTLQPHLSCGNGELMIEQHDTDWVVQLWITRRHGVRLAGPPPLGLIDPILPDKLRAAVRELFFYWWAPMAAEPAPLMETAYQVYAVLTMPRMLYTFAHGSVVSKPDAVAWAQRALDPRWAVLVAEALAWEEGQVFDHLEDTRALIRFTGEKAGATQHLAETGTYSARM
jgi:hypothetical protein